MEVLEKSHLPFILYRLSRFRSRQFIFVPPNIKINARERELLYSIEGIVSK
ncbi:MAG: hypothetical protein PHO84_05385 [Dysgonamonadaceae bacterium]|nr:hypothetical protein [Dysgonamonadaceae bacterium]MDD3356406.1 hypothetical protein [Dysgonamonadaceae bacterium]MDD3728327.1 hypothetical protein [Dysgonamonadaceae bacterium]MDD4246571.1 hypothetical protein [Dysgonamonadaceae bacterium]MDD4605639.1 hypothetical protein [Dysgonamonadaceae bacterium]